MFDATLDWYDSEQTILIMEVQADIWEWENTLSVMRELKQKSESVEHDVYTILMFNNTPPTPGRDVFRNVRQIIKLHPENNRLTIFVGTNTLFRAIFKTVNKLYLLKNIFDDFRYVATKEQALEIIQQEKAKASTK